MATLKVCDWQGCAVTGRTGKDGNLKVVSLPLRFLPGRHVLTEMRGYCDVCKDHIVDVKAYVERINRVVDKQLDFDSVADKDGLPETPDGPTTS